MAVYTKLTLDALAPTLKSYSIGTGQKLTPIYGGTANTNYKLTTNKGTYVCTLFEAEEEAQQLKWLPQYLNFLHSHGLPIPPPVANSKGSYVQTYQNKTLVLTPFVCGTERTITPKTAYKTGNLLGKLHNISLGYNHKTPHPWAPLHLQEKFKTCTALALPKAHQAILKTLKAEKPEWQTPINHLPQGVIHADVFPDNVLFDDQGSISGLIDFYKAGHDAFAYDLAMTLTAWSFNENNTFAKSTFNALYQGYTSQRPLTQEECLALPMFLRRACCVIVVMRLQSWQKKPKGGITPRNPGAYLKRLLFFKNNPLEALID